MSRATEQIDIRSQNKTQSNDVISWIIICVFSVFTILFTFVGPSKVLNYAFPGLSFLVAIVLYSRNPILYNGFSWWIWFLAALVRRLVDLRSGFTEPSPLLLAPYLVNMASCMTMWQSLIRKIQADDIPFLLVFYGVLYGAIVGAITKSLTTVFIGTLNWMAPIVFGFHIYKNWRFYPEYKQNTQRVFIWGILVMGVYGIFQYFQLSKWDLLWLKETGMESSTGSIDDSTGGGMRIWSTMQSTEPFSAVMAGGLLLLISRESPLSMASSIVGYIAFLLTLARSAWLGWIAGLIKITLTLNPKQKARLLSLLICLSIFVVPLSLNEQFSEKITGRLDSLSNVKEDASAQIRQDDFNRQINQALTNPVGNGIENNSMDSALLSTLFYLGWVGTIPYTIGLCMACYQLFNISGAKSDTFISACQGIAISALIRFPVNGSNSGVSGVMLWTFIALGLASERYNRYQSIQKQAA
jgi:uncharacterized membrane protein